jgi:hypothetical protein
LFFLRGGRGGDEGRRATHQREEVGGALLEGGAEEAVEHLDVDEVDGQLARVLVELLAVVVWFWGLREREREGEEA